MALQQIDLLETPAFKDVIVLSTVLQEVKHRQGSVYSRLRALIADPARHWCCFVNEHHRECFVERRPGESPNDRNDRGGVYFLLVGSSVFLSFLSTHPCGLRELE